MTRIQDRSKRVATGIVAAAMLAVGLGQAPAVGQVSPNTPDGQITSVTGNLNKAYGADHTGPLHNMTSVKEFVRETLKRTAYFPDVVLLQEVRAESAKGAAQAFTSQTGQKYVVAVMPGKIPTLEFGTKQIHTDTGILINTLTMKKLTDGGFFLSKYTKDQAAPGVRVSIAKQAFVLVKQRTTGLKVALSSVHLTPDRALKSKSVADRLRKAWSKQIVTKLRSKFPTAGLIDVAGDFNAERCFSGEFQSCVVARFWKYLTGVNFIDSLWEVPDPSNRTGHAKLTGVDYIWSTGAPLKGGRDETDRQRLTYSDHQLRWVVSQS